jgi:hypothetical protein
MPLAPAPEVAKALEARAWTPRAISKCETRASSPARKSPRRSDGNDLPRSPSANDRIRQADVKDDIVAISSTPRRMPRISSETTLSAQKLPRASPNPILSPKTNPNPNPNPKAGLQSSSIQACYGNGMQRSHIRSFLAQPSIKGVKLSATILFPPEQAAEQQRDKRNPEIAARKLDSSQTQAFSLLTGKTFGSIMPVQVPARITPSVSETVHTTSHARWRKWC